MTLPIQCSTWLSIVQVPVLPNGLEMNRNNHQTIGVFTQKSRGGCSKFLGGRGPKIFRGGCRGGAQNFFYCIFGRFTDPSLKNFSIFLEKNFFSEYFASRKFFLCIFRRFFSKKALKKAIFWRLGGVVTHLTRGGPSELQGGGPPPDPPPKNTYVAEYIFCL